MSDPAIRLHDVSKSYAQYARPMDRLLGLIAGKQPQHVFWALRHVNFEVRRGETVALVGRNGSGKSTLLQIVAGTLTPTSGTVEVHGRISALLELGSGFNPEFTGRENVIFQGRLQGFDRRQMEERFDQIAAFADIGDFIEQPVKTYSSGMYVRLAFAVAVSTDPDILIVDEALAVGDEAFQRKCFARLREIQDRGGTILFVSHAAAAVVELCDRAALLDGGEVLLDQTAKAVVARYHQFLFAPAAKLPELRAQIRAEQDAPSPVAAAGAGEASPPVPADAPVADTEDFCDPNMVPQSTVRYVSRGAEILHPGIFRGDGSPVNVLRNRGVYRYKYQVRFDKTMPLIRFGMLIKSLNGLELAGAVSHPLAGMVPEVPAGAVVDVQFEFRCLLPSGVYFMNCGVSSFAEGSEIYLDRIIDAVMFKVQPETLSVATGLTDFGIVPHVHIVAPVAAAS